MSVLGSVKNRSKVVTIHDVARHAGVSSMTVSRTINGERYVSPALREQVLASIKALSCSINVAARNTRSGASAQRIGILHSNPSSAYLNEIMLGGLQESGRNGTQLLLETCTGLASQQTALKNYSQQALMDPFCRRHCAIPVLQSTC